jgi:hypothetical protein
MTSPPGGEHAPLPSPIRGFDIGSDDPWDSDDMIDDGALAAALAAAEAPPSPPPPTLDTQQQLVVDLVTSGRNVFFSGPGGVGKSFTLGRVKTALEAKYGVDFHKRVCVCAPTGIAALNVGGSTIHSATGIGVPQEVGDFGRIFSRVDRTGEQWFTVWKEVEVLIIDEISMLSGEFLDNLDVVLRTMRLRKGHPARPVTPKERGEAAKLAALNASATANAAMWRPARACCAKRSIRTRSISKPPSGLCARWKTAEPWRSLPRRPCGFCPSSCRSASTSLSPT